MPPPASPSLPLPSPTPGARRPAKSRQHHDHGDCRHGQRDIDSHDHRRDRGDGICCDEESFRVPGCRRPQRAVHRPPRRNHSACRDADGNGDPTCAEAWNKDDGLGPPAYGDNRKEQAGSTSGLRRARRVTATASRARAPGTRMDVLPPPTRPHRSPVYEGARPDRRRRQTCRSAKRACGRDVTGMPSVPDIGRLR